MSPEVVWRRTLAVGWGSRLYRELMTWDGKFWPGWAFEMLDLREYFGSLTNHAGAVVAGLMSRFSVVICNCQRFISYFTKLDS